jgi:hypothetical protein
MMGGVFGRARNDVPPKIEQKGEICGAERLHASRKPQSVDITSYVLNSRKEALWDHILALPLPYSA